MCCDAHSKHLFGITWLSLDCVQFSAALQGCVKQQGAGLGLSEYSCCAVIWGVQGLGLMLFISIPAGSPLRNTVLIKQALKLLYSSQALYRSVSEARIPSPVLFPLLESARIHSDPFLSQ